MGCTSSKSAASKGDEKTAAERKAAWEEIRKELPRKKTSEDKKRRIELFKKFDKDNGGSLTLEETYQGCIDILRLDRFTPRVRDITKRSFNKAKDMGNKAEGKGSSKEVEFLEFRLMLCYIYDYFELTVMFDEIDASGNGIIDEKEFAKAALQIEDWGVKVSDPAKVFTELDANGSGQVTFDEFAVWACSNKLDADGDPDNDAPAATPATYPADAPAPAAASPPAVARSAPVAAAAPAEKTAADRKTAWAKIRAALPRTKTAEDKARRIELFKKFDKNNSGKLTMQETYTGCTEVLHLEDFTPRVKDIVKRSFSKAKDMGTKVEGKGDEDFVEFLEFRLMLCYIYDYFEITVMFDEMDADGNMTLDKNEFKQAVPKLAEWGVHITDADKTFNEIDDNNSGKVTFDEFAAWASAKKLDADGDPDNVE